MDDLILRFKSHLPNQCGRKRRNFPPSLSPESSARRQELYEQVESLKTNVTQVLKFIENMILGDLGGTE